MIGIMETTFGRDAMPSVIRIASVTFPVMPVPWLFAWIVLTGPALAVGCAATRAELDARGKGRSHGLRKTGQPRPISVRSPVRFHGLDRGSRSKRGRAAARIAPTLGDVLSAARQVHWMVRSPGQPFSGSRRNLACQRWAIHRPGRPAAQSIFVAERRFGAFGGRYVVFYRFRVEAGKIRFTAAGIRRRGLVGVRRCTTVLAARPLGSQALAVGRHRLYLTAQACRRALRQPHACPFVIPRCGSPAVLAKTAMPKPPWIANPRQDHLLSAMRSSARIYKLVRRGKRVFCQAFRFQPRTGRPAEGKLTWQSYNRRLRGRAVCRYGYNYKRWWVSFSGPYVFFRGKYRFGYGHVEHRRVTRVTREHAVMDGALWYFTRSACLRAARRPKAIQVASDPEKC